MLNLKKHLILVGAGITLLSGVCQPSKSEAQLSGWKVTIPQPSLESSSLDHEEANREYSLAEAFCDELKRTRRFQGSNKQIDANIDSQSPNSTEDNNPGNLRIDLNSKLEANCLPSPVIKIKFYQSRIRTGAAIQGREAPNYTQLREVGVTLEKIGSSVDGLASVTTEYYGAELGTRECRIVGAQLTRSKVQFFEDHGFRMEGRLRGRLHCQNHVYEGDGYWDEKKSDLAFSTQMVLNVDGEGDSKASIYFLTSSSDNNDKFADQILQGLQYPSKKITNKGY